jgi:hypothetical protein
MAGPANGTGDGLAARGIALGGSFCGIGRVGAERGDRAKHGKQATEQGTLHGQKLLGNCRIRKL